MSPNMRQLLHLTGDPALGTRPQDLDVDHVLHVVDRLRPVFGDEGSYFPIDAQGFDRVPAGPVLVVSNHSGGTSIPDAWGLGVSWYRHFGRTRPAHALAHDMVFARLGILRARRDIALRALTTCQRDVVVMPGGDRDTWRPWKDRYKVCFAGRKGYARLALRAGVPIVPVAHAGAHDTLIVLTDGQRVARRLHLPELFRAQIFPVHLSLPFIVGVGPSPHIPPPVTLRYRIADAIWPTEEVAPGAEPSEAAVAEMDAQVRAALQERLDALRDTTAPFGQRVRGELSRIRHLRQHAADAPQLVAAR